jgi:3-oxoacyl-[acyl-carrier protein] reductase
MTRFLDDRCALITGSVRGLGLAAAHRFAAAGCHIVMNGFGAPADVDDSRRAIEQQHGVRTLYSAADLRQPAQIAQMVSAARETFGSIDILVNNAGMTRDNIMLRLKDEDWDQVLDANLRGAFVAIRAATRGMMKRRWGRIINISSVVGLVGNKGQSNYAASKAGLIGLTKSVAKEFASRNILANAIAPGFIETDMTDTMTAEARAALTGSIPLARLGSPADVAAMVAFLASDHASYITGQVLVVDGGMVM